MSGANQEDLKALVTGKRRRRWVRNIALTAQAIAEHVVDDPILLALQGSRRMPESIRRETGYFLASAGSRSLGAVEAFGFELAGDHVRAGEALDETFKRFKAKGRSARGKRLLPHLADIALSIGDDQRVEDILRAVPLAKRRAPWYATAARLALFRGDHEAAVDLACRHPRNASLARRMVGERAVFDSYNPVCPPERDYEPVPGRVLHALTNSLPYTKSGYTQRSHLVLLSLAKRGYTVRAITRPGFPASMGVLWGAEEDVIDGIEYRRLIPNRMAQGLQEQVDQHVHLLAEQVRQFRPSVLHTTTHFSNALAVRAVAEAFGIPWVYEVRGQLADTWASARGPEATESQRYKQFVAREHEVTQSADAVITLGANMRSSLVEGGVKAETISVCPNAVGPLFTATPPTKVEARAELGLEQDALYIGTVSSLVYYEGYDLLLRAAAKLAPKFPNLRVRIAGDGMELFSLEVMAEELGIADICEFPGRVSRQDALLNHAALDVFVVPRKDHRVTRNVTPMKTVEASAVGRPVVAARLPALEELVEEGVTGALFEAENVDALATTLADLLADPVARERMGAAGRAWALATRTWVANAETYASVYEWLIASPARAERASQRPK